MLKEIHPADVNDRVVGVIEIVEDVDDREDSTRNSRSLKTACQILVCRVPWCMSARVSMAMPV